MQSKTKRLYFENPYQTEFESAVKSMVQKDGKHLVVLEESCFYPESGGQPADRGDINGIDVLDVFEENDDCGFNSDNSDDISETCSEDGLSETCSDDLSETCSEDNIDTKKSTPTKVKKRKEKKMTNKIMVKKGRKKELALMQILCCIDGCKKECKNRLNTSLKLPTVFDEEMIKRGQTNICAKCYFSDLYRWKKKNEKNLT
ncbi:MAG TPA: hypothetical protein ENL46_01345 [Candidatus Aminicenantes bacterium]|nr:hypothetical protein [Candidatus Aminicenantes bacterium]